jgi:hypothetical protein
MEAWFACLEALVTSMAFSMATQVKPIAPTPGDSSAQGFDPGFFCGVGFSWPLGPNEIELDIPNVHVFGAANDKTLVRVSIVTPIT